MEILLLSSHHPQGQASGSPLRVLNTLRTLEGLGRVTLVTVGAEGSAASAGERVHDRDEPTIALHPAPASPLGLRGKVAGWSDPRAPYPHGMAVPAADQDRLRSTLDRYDLIWVFKLRVANMFGWWQWPRTVVDIDDVPSTYEAAVARAGNTLGERLQARLRTVVWHRRERLLLERFSVLATCSEADKRWLGGNDRIHVIPNGLPRPAASPVRCPVSPPRIGFIGLFDHVPNRDGMAWFLRESWPLLKTQIPGVKLRLVGRGGAEVVPAGDGDVEALGWVADPSEEISTWALTIIPLRLGAGTRVKLPDAFSRKCPVVSTALGAYGYDVAYGRELRLADTAAGFAQACADLIRNPEQGAAMAERAWNRFLKEWSWETIQPRIRKAVEHCLVLNRAQPKEPWPVTH